MLVNRNMWVEELNKVNAIDEVADVFGINSIEECDDETLLEVMEMIFGH